MPRAVWWALVLVACQRDRASGPPAEIDPSLTAPLIHPQDVRRIVPPTLADEPATEAHDFEHSVQQLYGTRGSGAQMVLSIETGFFHDERDTAAYKHACPHYEPILDHQACVTRDVRGFEIRFMLMPSHLVVDLAGYDEDVVRRAAAELPIAQLASWK